VRLPLKAVVVVRRDEHTNFVLTSHIYIALATSILLLHGLFILWVVLGAIATRFRPGLHWLHIASLVWGILTEVLPWPCPLTLLENWLESRGGVAPYQGGFLLHYMDRFVYPDVSATLLTVAGVTVCTLNLAFYARLLGAGPGKIAAGRNR
jgi:hypothetical protein